MENGNIREVLFLFGELHKNKSFQAMMKDLAILSQLNKETDLNLQVDPNYGSAGIGVLNSAKMRSIRPNVAEINKKLVEEENPTYEEYNAKALCPLSCREEAHLRSISKESERMPHGNPSKIFIAQDFDDPYWKNMDTYHLNKIAGVSNSVDQIMTAAMALGGDFHKVLTACMAVFVDGEAHSLYEVAAVARSFGEEPNFEDITSLLDLGTKKIFETVQGRLPMFYLSEINVLEAAKGLV